MPTIEVNILLPEEVLSFACLGKEEIREEMRRLLLLELVREGKIPYGKAAELLGIGQAEFLQYEVVVRGVGHSGAGETYTAQ